jgi:hypothetical protein
MEGIEPSLNLAAANKVEDLMEGVSETHEEWRKDRAHPETIAEFKTAAYKLYSYLISLETVVKG